MRPIPTPHSRSSPSLPFCASRFGVIMLAAVLLVACASRTRAPVEDRTAVPVAPAAPIAAPAPAPPAEATSRAPTYTVKRGDTLYQIALDHGLDYKDLAAWNNLENPNKILIGQVLVVAAPGDTSATGSGVTTAPLRASPAVTEAKPGAVPNQGSNAGAGNGAAGAQPGSAQPSARNPDNYKSAPKAVKEPYSEQALREVARGAQVTNEVVAIAAPSGAPKAESSRTAPPAASTELEDDDRLDWVWPAKGKVVVRLFRDRQPEGHRHRRRRRRARNRERGRQGRLRRQRPARLRQARHRQAQQHVVIRLRSQPGDSGQGRPTGHQGPENCGDGQHGRRSGETAFRNSAIGQAGGPRPIPSGGMSAKPGDQVAWRNAAGDGSTSIARSSVASSASRWRGAVASP